VAAGEHPALEAVRQAGAAADFRTLLDLTTRRPAESGAPARDASRRADHHAGTAVQARDAAPVRVDVRYGSILLARGVEVPRGSLIRRTSVPWHGGALDPSRFDLEDACAPEAPRATALLVAVRPALSVLEEAVLERIPPDAGDVDLAAHAAEAYDMLRRAALREKLRDRPVPSIDDPV
jgi:hypothetical protein